MGLCGIFEIPKITSSSPSLVSSGSGTILKPVDFLVASRSRPYPGRTLHWSSRPRFPSGIPQLQSGQPFGAALALVGPLSVVRLAKVAFDLLHFNLIVENVVFSIC